MPGKSSIWCKLFQKFEIWSTFRKFRTISKFQKKYRRRRSCSTSQRTCTHNHLNCQQIGNCISGHAWRILLIQSHLAQVPGSHCHQDLLYCRHHGTQTRHGEPGMRVGEEVQEWHAQLDWKWIEEDRSAVWTRSICAGEATIEGRVSCKFAELGAARQTKLYNPVGFSYHYW